VIPDGPLASIESQIASGPFAAAAALAAAAGVLSFLSPCVLPLVPGYLSFVTGLSASQLRADGGGSRPALRVLLAGLLFVLGFSVVFVSFGALAGGLGSMLKAHQHTVTITLGAFTILLGLMFAGAFDRLAIAGRELRFHHVPTAGLGGAPLLGVLFALGWTPCIGPTLAAVLGLAASSDGASAARGTALAFVYCLGLGVPFLATGLAFQRAMSAFGMVKRHYRAVTTAGGGMLVVIGVLELTGRWTHAVSWLQERIGSVSLPL